MSYPAPCCCRSAGINCHQTRAQADIAEKAEKTSGFKAEQTESKDSVSRSHFILTFPFFSAKTPAGSPKKKDSYTLIKGFSRAYQNL